MANCTHVPAIGATGKYDGEWVTVVRHDASAIIFRKLSNGQGTFPIYDADWAELSPRLTDFAVSAYGPRNSHLWEL